MFKNRSKTIFICAMLGSLYLIYIINHFSGAVMNSEGAEQIGVGIATAIVLPHMTFLAFAVLFNWLGFFLKSSGFTLTSAILYSVSAIAFILYIIFVIPMIILGFIGYAKQKKINSKFCEPINIKIIE